MRMRNIELSAGPTDYSVHMLGDDARTAGRTYSLYAPHSPLAHTED